MKLSELYLWTPCVGCSPCSVYCVMDSTDWEDATKEFIDLMMDEFIDACFHLGYDNGWDDMRNYYGVK
jgi:hypothetical protein